jgi:hypothetical protein
VQSEGAREPAHAQADQTPVFVDDSGRRHRLVRATGWIVGVLMAGYLALLTISLVGSPGLVPLSLPALGRVLPGPAAPGIEDPSHERRTPSDLLATPTPSPAAGGGTSSTGTVTGGSSTAGAGTASAATHRATPRPTPTPTAKTTASATTSPTATPTPTSAHPTHSPSPHPSPKNTRRSTPRATASPTPTATAS